jgi:hypothetical protein
VPACRSAKSRFENPEVHIFHYTQKCNVTVR